MLELQPIERRSGLQPETFAAEFLEPMIPVVLTDLMDDWPARQKWTIDYIKTRYGHLRVPVVSNNYSKPGKGYMSPDRIISFKEYLEILESGPTDLRIFLWNIFRVTPELRQDFRIPTIMDGFVNELPFMFFGGQGSKVALHYDIDMSHVFLNQIHGRKRVVLFAPDQSRMLYRHPFTVASYVVGGGLMVAGLLQSLRPTETNQAISPLVYAALPVLIVPIVLQSKQASKQRQAIALYNSGR